MLVIVDMQLMILENYVTLNVIHLDNVSELTARINDEGWENSFVDWLKVSNLNKKMHYLFFQLVVVIKNLM